MQKQIIINFIVNSINKLKIIATTYKKSIIFQIVFKLYSKPVIDGSIEQVLMIVVQAELKMQNSQYIESISYSQMSCQKYGRPKKQQKYVSGQNNGKWSQLQNAKYIAYIEFHKDKMRSKEKRRINKLYKEMAKFIKTRNALQCRSHHQKLQNRYLYPNKIISHFKEHNQLTNYYQLKQELEEQEVKTSTNSSSYLKLQDQNRDQAVITEIEQITFNKISISPPSVHSQMDMFKNNYCLTGNGISYVPYMGDSIYGRWLRCFFYPVFQTY